MPLGTIERVLGVFSSGVKRPGSQFDRSFPSSTDVKNDWSDASNPHMCLHGEFRGNIIFTGETTQNVAGIR